jgi:hypothetical protein
VAEALDVKTGRVEQLLATFSRPDVGIQIKRQNTERFLAAALSAAKVRREPREEDEEPEPPEPDDESSSYSLISTICSATRR